MGRNGAVPNRAAQCLRYEKRLGADCIWVRTIEHSACPDRPVDEVLAELTGLSYFSQDDLRGRILERE
jgi:hypothetical protein